MSIFRVSRRQFCEKILSSPSGAAATFATDVQQSAELRPQIQQNQQQNQQQQQLQGRQTRMKLRPAATSTLTPQQKEQIASKNIISPAEAQKIERLIIRNQVYGYTGLFFSLVTLITGCVMLLQ